MYPPRRSRPWRTGTIPVYLVAHHAKSQLWHASTLLFGFFLTEACGIDARSMGWIMAASLLLNGVIDWCVGRWLRDSVTQEMIARRLQARGTALTCGFFLLFCATPLVPTDARSAWALATLLGFRATYPLLDVPQNAFAALLPLGRHARCTLLAGRNIASGLAAVAVSLVAAPMLIGHTGIVGWMIWAGGLSAFVCGTAWWLARMPAIENMPRPEADAPTPPGLPFSTILCALAVMIAASAMFRVIEPYYAAFAADGAGLLLWASVGGTLSQPAWAWCRRRWAESGVLIGAAILLLGAAATLSSAQRCSPIGIVLIGSAFGVGSGGLWLMLWADMMDRAARGNATRYVGTFTCVSKAAQAAAILLTGHVLAATPYRFAMRDPLSWPSLSMVGALVAIAGVCLALALEITVSRIPSDGTPARPHRAGRKGRAPDLQPPARSMAHGVRGASASDFPAIR